MFKPGDKVRCHERNAIGLRGQLCTIYKVSKNGAVCQVHLYPHGKLIKNEVDNKVAWIPTSTFHLVPERSPFKVYQKVRIINDNMFVDRLYLRGMIPPIYNGRIVTVRRVHESQLDLVEVTINKEPVWIYYTGIEEIKPRNLPEWW